MSKKAAGVFIHIATVTEGTIVKGQPAKLEVGHARRAADPRQPFGDAPSARGAAAGAWATMWRSAGR